MKTKRTIITPFALGCVTAFLMSLMVVPGFAATVAKNITVYTGITLYYDGVKVEPKDATGKKVAPLLYNGTTYLPVRAISNLFGEAINWDGSTQSVYIGDMPGKKTYLVGASTVKFHEITEPSPTGDFDDTPQYAIITGFKEDGTEVWSIRTETDYGVSDCGFYNEVGTNQGVFYYFDHPRCALVALDISTGKVLWENFELQDMWPSEVDYSQDGTLLICCENGAFWAIHPNGTTWYQTHDISFHSKIIAVEERGDTVIVTLRSDDWGTYSIFLCEDSWVDHMETPEVTTPEKSLDAAALREMGIAYETGNGVPQNYSTAVSYYQQAAELGDMIAQRNLGICYKRGQGIAQNYEMAVYWYRQAAAQGDDVSQNNLGNRYLQGLGVEQDDGQAVYWYRQAAEQGNPDALYNLATCYESGRGVKANIQTAIMYYQLSADQGERDAKQALKRLGQL